MSDGALAKRFARTYRHAVTAYRPMADGGEETVCRGAKCALSRSAQVSAPQPPAVTGSVPEADFRLTLFTEPERCFRLGDRLEISEGDDAALADVTQPAGARVWHATASDSFRYPTHAVTVVEVREVTEKRA